MTTTNPTPEQVEAAAMALANREPMRSATAWKNLHEHEREKFREKARAALVAAASVAPQPEGGARERLTAVEAELAEWVAGTRSWCDQHHGKENAIELTARADAAQVRLLTAKRDAILATATASAPVVDESKLAEVIEASSAEWGDSDRIQSVLAQYIASAVAEWLRGDAV